MIMNWKQLQKKEDLLRELHCLTEQSILAEKENNFSEQERLANEISILLKYIDKQEWTYTLEELGL
tara:strand:- start:53792 stop:53989 length:198 start_codon:yes stop_codon:yes gene_type:complete